jgi:hypothetical protein
MRQSILQGLQLLGLAQISSAKSSEVDLNTAKFSHYKVQDNKAKATTDELVTSIMDLVSFQSLSPCFLQEQDHEVAKRETMHPMNRGK